MLKGTRGKLIIKKLWQRKNDLYLKADLFNVTLSVATKWDIMKMNKDVIIMINGLACDVAKYCNWVDEINKS